MIGFTPLEVSKYDRPGREPSLFAASSSNSRSVSSLSLCGSLVVNLGKLSSLLKRACSIASGEPYISSSLSHAINSPAFGYLMLTALILLTCSEDSLPRYLDSRSSSSPADRSKPAIAVRKDAFHAQ